MLRAGDPGEHREPMGVTGGPLALLCHCPSSPGFRMPSLRAATRSKAGLVGWRPRRSPDHSLLGLWALGAPRAQHRRHRRAAPRLSPAPDAPGL